MLSLSLKKGGKGIPFLYQKLFHQITLKKVFGIIQLK